MLTDSLKRNSIHGGVNVQYGNREFVNQSFLSRIEFILDGRTPFPWADAVGIGRGVMSRIREGVIPTADSLSAIGRVENCSLSWLLTGKGSPYIVSRCDSDEECAERLEEFLAEEWEITLLTDGERMALLLTQPATFFYKDRPVVYTSCETLAGPIGPFTLDAVKKAAHTHTTAQATLTPDQITRLISGQIGTYEMLAKNGGLLRDAQPLDETRLTVYSGSAEEREAYNEPERQLLKAWRKLDGPLKSAALAAVEAMGKK